MTSFANNMQTFLWQIATVIPIKGTRASINNTCALNRDDGRYLPQEYLHLVDVMLSSI